MDWYMPASVQAAHLQNKFNQCAYKRSGYRLIKSKILLPHGPARQTYKTHHLEAKMLKQFPRGKAAKKMAILAFK